MNLISRNMIAKMRGNEDMSNLIPRSFFDDDFDSFFFSKPRRNNMKCDIYEQDGKYHIEMDIPGFAKEDIKIEVNDGCLTVKASKTQEENSESKNYIRRERGYGGYQRTFVLDDADDEKIEAKFEQGMLKIVIPKKTSSDTTKSIEIK